jgi:ribosomal protein S18 acetylase RimI-like enzyme
MVLSMGRTPESVVVVMCVNFEPWVAGKIVEGRYLGWIVEDGNRPVASAGMMVLDWPPTPYDPAGEQRGYLLNIFVEPEYRRRGLARSLVNLCMAEARRRGLRVVALHASEAGRPLYQGLGFHVSDEMLHVEPALG